MTLFAREKDEHVVCGMRDCGTRLARIVAVRPALPEDWVPPENWGYRLIVFDAGWLPRQSDYTWARTDKSLPRERREQRRFDQGRNEAILRPRFDNRPVDKASHAVTLLPANVKCFACGQVQTLDADRLHIQFPPDLGDTVRPEGFLFPTDARGNLRLLTTIQRADATDFKRPLQ